jgi:FtsX extracellular domain
VSGQRSLRRVDRHLGGRRLAGQYVVRWIFLFTLAGVLLTVLLSAGIGRLLSSEYAITAVLRDSVSPDDAEGLARKAAALPPVLSARYRAPLEAWKEFQRAYPGLESLAESGRNPLPGYIEVRIRPRSFTMADLNLVISALRPLASVETVLAGEEYLPRLVRAEAYAAAVAWGTFGAAVAAFFLVCLLQEQVRALSLAEGFRFLADRGVSRRRLALSRAGRAAISGVLLAAAAAAAAGCGIYVLLGRFAFLERAIGSPDDLLTRRVAAAVIAFALGAGLLSAGSSLLAWRTTRGSRN